jgi:hypothetical protein
LLLVAAVSLAACTQTGAESETGGVSQSGAESETGGLSQSGAESESGGISQSGAESENRRCERGLGPKPKLILYLVSVPITGTK